MNDEELFERAIEHVKSKNYSRAIDYFKVILSKDKNNDDVWVLLGTCQIKLNDFEKAYISFNNALKINNEHSFAWSGKAYLLFLAEKYDKALIYCNFALRYYPENYNALIIKKDIENIISNENKKIEKHENKFDVENILNSFNTQKDTDNYLIEEDEEFEINKLNELDLNKIEGHKTISDLNQFENIFTKKRLNLLKDNQLTVEEYDNILFKIKESGKNNFNNILKEHDISLSEISIFKKISLLALSYTDIEYKTKGAEHGSYAFNIIRVDDRLDESNQISTIIHELTHHILNEIFTQSLMYIWNTDKTNAIEAISIYCISNSKYYRLMNEYCAHTVQGRFLPFGYQNYGSFNMLLKSFDSKKDKDKIKYYLRLGNSFAEDIILILEEFITKNWRNEIKLQFKNDFTHPPNYDGILQETKKTVNKDERVKQINKILSEGVFSIIINDDIEVIRKYKKEYESNS
ncbi:M48 family metallopeptidase [uncultured Methanobrevibacter sp.]|uniref:tetratricopeptide repeat protein n=1 Tax=uncultured Methanobrevibacter sp. TaxID=253161 RepID=UPI002623A83A|nr:tetratricopeptide repeat protein [uncultured Methanobrevibacter sp.]